MRSSASAAIGDASAEEALNRIGQIHTIEADIRGQAPALTDLTERLRMGY